jgi:hypothetical protein
MAVWYIRDNTGVGWTAVTTWSTGAVKTAGTLIKQLAAPTVGNERVFIAVVGGTTGGAEPTWVITKGGKTTDNTITWQECTGQPGINGDVINTPNWAAIKNTAVALGYIIKNAASTFLFICSTAGTAGNGAEPTWTNTAGITTADNTITWTCIGAATFTNWAAPFSRLNNSLITTWAVAGDIIYVAADHNETQASIIGFNGGAINQAISIYCVPVTTIPPIAVATGATISTSGSNDITWATGINSSTMLFFYGITFSVSSGSIREHNNAGSTTINLSFEACTFILSGSNVNSRIVIGSSVIYQSFNFYHRNCTYIFNIIQHQIAMGLGDIKMIGNIYAPSGVIPTTLFSNNVLTNSAIIRDSDLSTINTTLVNLNSGASTNLIIENCKLNAGVTIASNAALVMAGDNSVQLQNCDSAATNYRQVIIKYTGTQQTSIAIFRAGTIANDGTNNFSMQLITSANSIYIFPFESQETIFWNNTIGVPRTLTLYFTSATAGLTNADIWLGVEYLNSNTSPQGIYDTSTRKLPLAATTALTIDSISSWTGGLGNNYSIALTFTAQLRGPVRVKVIVAKPSLTVNCDLPTLV